MTRTVAIIGAGIAGLSTARVLIACGYDVTLFEKEHDLGGVWASSRRYPGLSTQNPKETYAFSDWPMPQNYPEWPDGAQMQAYLQSYADHFRVTPHIRFNTPIVAVAPAANGEGWTLTQATGATTQAHTFDWLVACNGIFSIPSVPDFPGRALFEQAGGEICHTSEMTDKAHTAGKDVLVVGYGKSSCDLANAVAPVSKSTTMVVRRLIWKLPKFVGNAVHMKHLFLNRLGEGLFPWMELKGFEAFLHGRGKKLRDGVMAVVQNIISRQLSLRKVGLEPDVPLETIARSTVSLVTDGFYEKVADGSIGFARNVEIAELSAGQARLTDGTVLPADLIVCGTGWHQKAGFLPEEVLAKVTDAHGNFLLYRSMVPLNVPRLLFNGYNSSFFSQLNAEMGAIWIAAYLEGHITLPDEPAMRTAVKNRLAWMEERTSGKHCKGTNIVPFSIHHVDEMLQDMDLELPVALRVRQWTRTVRSNDFKTVWERFDKRRQAA